MTPEDRLRSARNVVRALDERRLRRADIDGDVELALMNVLHAGESIRTGAIRDAETYLFQAEDLLVGIRERLRRVA